MGSGGIGGIPGGVGHVGLGQDVQTTHTAGQSPEAQTAWVRATIDGIGEQGRAPDIRPDIRAGTAQDAPRLDEARGKSGIEKFFSSVGNGIKSVFTKVADKIADLVKPQPAYNLNLGNKPPAQLTRETFVPLSEFAPLSEATGPVIGAAREGTPKSVNALTELQTQIDAMMRSADGKSDPAERAGVFNTLFRGQEDGVKANREFVTSHLDFRSIAEDVISSSADQIMGAAKKYEAFLDAAGEGMGAEIYHLLIPQGTPEADAMAEEARHAVVVAVFETADRMLDAMLATDGWVAGLSDDLKAFTSAKMDVIASSDARSEEKAGMARKLLTNDFLLRGAVAEVSNARVGMDDAAAAIISNSLKLVMSLLNNSTVDRGSDHYEPAKELFQTLRDKHQDEPMDAFLQALGMPAEYRKDA
jgi:hypothetical protein